MIRFVLAFFYVLIASSTAYPQALVVTTCGTAPPSGGFAPGSLLPPTMDKNGNTCTTGGGGGGTTIGTVNQGTAGASAWLVSVSNTPAVTVTATATGGFTPKILNALTNSAVSVKGSAGQLGMLQCGNTNSSEQYVQVFNVASGSVTVGVTTPTFAVPIAATATGGFAMSPLGVQFSTAISVAATTTATGGSAPSTALDCNVAFN